MISESLQLFPETVLEETKVRLYVRLYMRAQVVCIKLNFEPDREMRGIKLVL